MAQADQEANSAPERSRRTLAGGVLLFRWVALAWMTTIAAAGSEPFRHPVVAWASIAVAAAWTLWLTFSRNQWIDAVLWADLALCLWLLIASGIVVPAGDIISQRPFFATGYPLSAALLWGVARGPVGGIVAGAVLGLGLVLARPLNGVPLTALSGPEIQNLAGAVLNYLVAGGAVGLVARLLVSSATALQGATEALVRERERAARLAERESLARQIHDSVLQALALVHKRGRELSTKEGIPGEEVARLAEMAGQQEAELRGLILRRPVEVATGTKSLRHELESSARSLDGFPATVSSVGPIFLDAPAVDEIAAAVRQSLENVVAHARASHATVFADEENGEVVVTVRDDGVGFVYDEEVLRREGKVGMLKSMKGRVKDLGGSMKVTTAPGRGSPPARTRSSSWSPRAIPTRRSANGCSSPPRPSRTTCRTSSLSSSSSGATTSCATPSRRASTEDRNKTAARGRCPAPYRESVAVAPHPEGGHGASGRAGRGSPSAERTASLVCRGRAPRASRPVERARPAARRRWEHPPRTAG